MRSKKQIEKQLRAIEVELEQILENRDKIGISELKYALYHVWSTLLWVLHDDWEDRPEVLRLGPYEFYLDRTTPGSFSSTHSLHVYTLDQDGNKRELFIF